MNSGVILLVEDNPDDVDLMLRAFKKSNLGNQIVVVRDGQEALDYLFGQGAYEGRGPDGDPQLVLLDLQLPKIGGLEVLDRLRQDPRTGLIPVVILTSSAEERDRLDGYKLGANSYVVKPVDFFQFVDAVRQLGLYWLVLNQPSPAGKEA